jgi:hypothetical protein
MLVETAFLDFPFTRGIFYLHYYQYVFLRVK